MTKKWITRHMNRYTLSDKVYVIISFVLLSILTIVVVYPLLHVLISSLYSDYVVSIKDLDIQKFTTKAFDLAFNYKHFVSGLMNSLIYTAVGCFISLTTVILCAYPLSKRKFYCGKYVLGLCFIAMYFSGGIIPSYLVVRGLGLLDSMWAVILPSAFSVYNTYLLHVHFRHVVPNELEDAAKIDGCGEWRFLIQIILPLSVPMLTTIGLYYVVGSWNSYFSAMIYISTRSKWPLANVLREVLVSDFNSARAVVASNDGSGIPIVRQAEMLKYALIVVSSFPLLAIYPFLQRFFVHGVTEGSVKQ